MIPSIKVRADILERVLWTALQAGLGVVTVEAFNLPQAWIPVVAFVLAAAKSAVATQLGVKGSAATLPTSLDSAAASLEVAVEVPAE